MLCGLTLASQKVNAETDINFGNTPSGAIKSTNSNLTRDSQNPQQPLGNIVESGLWGTSK
ncbi:hypothetical protein [Xylocopilactobacillus apis]|uniref:Uncharacterized protein n=1 Tax=Xylocopilactobacillus apis TaxID=2932183 RepID=A0AAU9D956_9LACO|nr:hypothetical protein [Xylocopilactobacillus apis]BDR57332.1 hypothetical protein KIMC2_18940 [Xylocopilactobacillus apis]